MHFSSLPERFMCGVWLAMGDVASEPGPCSMRLALINGRFCTMSRSAVVALVVTLLLPKIPVARHGGNAKGQQRHADALLAYKGQALIWCANLFHGGSKQTELTLIRWSQATHYFFDDCIYYTPTFSDETVG